MSQFQVHTLESAPEKAKSTLESAKKSLGLVPNLYGIMAEAPAALKAYVAVSSAFSGTSLSSVEQQVVLLTVSVENGCDYCVAAHSAIAKMQSVPDHVVASLREGRTIDDPKLEPLRQLTIDIVRHRGWVEDASIQQFLNAGYDKKHIFEVLVGVTQKTLSNYVNHIAHTPLDTAFVEHSWEKQS